MRGAETTASRAMNSSSKRPQGPVQTSKKIVCLRQKSHELEGANKKEGLGNQSLE